MGHIKRRRRDWKRAARQEVATEFDKWWGDASQVLAAKHEGEEERVQRARQVVTRGLGPRDEPIFTGGHGETTLLRERPAGWYSFIIFAFVDARALRA